MSFQSWDFSNLDPRTAYQLMIESIIPRPIAWVSTQDDQGRGNLAPFSFFMGVSSVPPTLAFSVTARRSGDPKDTLQNILATREFVVHIVDESLLPQCNETAIDLPRGANERERVGLHTLPSTHVQAPRVAEAPIHLECVLEQTTIVGVPPHGATIIIGRIVAAHVRADLISSDGHIDWKKLAPVSRLGGAFYGLTRDGVELKRP